MNTDMGSRADELTKLIEEWAVKKGLLNPGEVLEVEVTIVRPPMVTVTLNGYRGLADKKKILLTDIQLDYHHHNRAQNALHDAGYVTVGDICDKTRAEMCRIRSLSPLGIEGLGRCLTSLGFKNDWVKEEKLVEVPTVPSLQGVSSSAAATKQKTKQRPKSKPQSKKTKKK